MTLSEDGSSAIAALGDGSLRRWDVSTGKEQSHRPAEDWRSYPRQDTRRLEPTSPGPSSRAMAGRSP